MEHDFGLAVALGFSAHSCKKMSYNAIIPFDREGLRLGGGMHTPGDDSWIGIPVIGHDLEGAFGVVELLPEPPPGPFGPRTQYETEESVAEPIHSDPDPTAVFFCWIKENISS